MRLRQVALVAADLEPPRALLETVFGLKTAFRDPGVGVFGLVNVVMPIGGEFLEIVQPVRPDASAARYLARRGGDAGYMVILQDGDALAHRARLEDEGVRVIARADRARYRFTHFHPGDCAGVLLSIDSVEGDVDWRASMSDWPPAGEAWRDFPSGGASGIASVTIQARDPAAAAELWALLLDRPARREGEAFAIDLDPGRIVFIGPVDADGTGVVGLDIGAPDIEATLARARSAGAPVEDGAVKICGVRLRPV